MIPTLSNSERNRLLTPIKKTILQYNMIEEGDRVAIGLSGGKDSSTLLYILTHVTRTASLSF